MIFANVKDSTTGSHELPPAISHFYAVQIFNGQKSVVFER